MINKYIIIIIFLCINKNYGQEKYVYDTKYGLYFENLDSTQTDIDKYSRDNIIYKIGSEFLYSVEYKNAEGKRKNLDVGGERVSLSNWKLIDTLLLSATAIKYVNMKVISLKDFFYSKYQQTPFEYNFLNYKKNNLSKLETQTGLIENSKNIWFHPPRQCLFMILEMNPFPFIQFPVFINKKWECSLTYLGDMVGDKNWVMWEGYLTDKRKYEIVSKEMIMTPFGLLECYKTIATSNSKLGLTSLISFYNDKYGFIKLDYNNIDGSKLVFNLVEAKLR